MVLNVTNQCNLSCKYCYEYGEDKIVDTENGKQPKFMSEETARESVDFMLKESGDNKVAHVTFFGGETLLNFPVLKKTIAYARQRAAELGKEVDFSLTTNGTLLKPDVIEFLAENQVGVTISIDGPKEVQDKFRVFHNGSGSYDVVAPKIKELLKRHRSRPIGARVTLTSGTDGRQADLPAPHRGDRVLGGRLRAGDDGARPRPRDFRDAATTRCSGSSAISPTNSSRRRLQNRHHGFSNVKETLEELHKGVSKAFPCGAGLGLAGRRDGRRRRAVPSLRGVRRAQARDGHRRHRSRCTAGVPRVAPHREQDRLQRVLGAAALLGRLLSRGAHALRRDDSAEPALLRLDPRLDRRLPEGVRRARRAQSRVPHPVRRRGREGAGVMNHLKAINRKASAGRERADRNRTRCRRAAADRPPQLLQPHFPIGCSLVFSPGWEADRTGGTAGLCQPVERDLFDCHIGCYWPAQVPDQLNHAPDWTEQVRGRPEGLAQDRPDFPVAAMTSMLSVMRRLAAPRRSRSPAADASARTRRQAASRCVAPATAR